MVTADRVAVEEILQLIKPTRAQRRGLAFTLLKEFNQDFAGGELRGDSLPSSLVHAALFDAQNEKYRAPLRTWLFNQTGTEDAAGILDEETDPGKGRKAIKVGVDEVEFMERSALGKWETEGKKNEVIVIVEYFNSDRAI
ncbi:unnamed protein product, partial [Amoebophrya sp. A25]|eukprot:GSA25T00013304001.1